MARPDDQGPGALRQLVVGVQPPEDDALEYVVHRFKEVFQIPASSRDLARLRERLRDRPPLGG